MYSYWLDSLPVAWQMPKACAEVVPPDASGERLITAASMTKDQKNRTARMETLFLENDESGTEGARFRGFRSIFHEAHGILDFLHAVTPAIAETGVS